MYLGIVTGTVVASRKAEGLAGTKLLLVQPVDEHGAHVGDIQAAVDRVQAGVGDLVYLVGSREAALACDPWFVPVDAAIVGIVDGIDVPRAAKARHMLVEPPDFDADNDNLRFHRRRDALRESRQVTHGLHATPKIVEPSPLTEHGGGELHHARATYSKDPGAQGLDRDRLETSELLIHQAAEIANARLALLPRDDPRGGVGFSTPPQRALEQAEDGDDR